MICTKNVAEFPASATDDLGRLRLDFLPSSLTLSHLTGRNIIRKCCDLNEAFLVNNRSCIPRDGYSTQFFDQLQENGNHFFRIGLLSCQHQTQVEDFRVTAAGQLQVQVEEGRAHLLIHPDDYCLDDFVVFWDDDLPEVVTLVNYCLDKSNKSLTLIPDIVHPEVEKVGEVAISIPKCCPRGQISDLDGCTSFPLANQQAKLEAMLLRAFRNHGSAANQSLQLVANAGNLPCQDFRTLQLSADEVNDTSWITPVFQTDAEGNVSLLFHYFVDKYWNQRVAVEPFCLEMKIYEQSYDVLYRPVVLYCTASWHVPFYTPCLLYISAVALLLTAAIYSFVPASSKTLHSFICCLLMVDRHSSGVKRLPGLFNVVKN